MKRFNTITAIKDINSDHWRNFYGSICQWVGLLVGIALSGTSLLPSLVTVITRTSFKNFTVKQEKDDAIKLLAWSKLDSIASIISQAMQDGDVSFIEFHIFHRSRKTSQT